MCCSSRRRGERDELSRICARFGESVPLLANMVEGGKTPILPASELEALGFAVVIFAAGIVRAVARTAEEFYALAQSQRQHRAVPRAHVRFRRAQSA